MCLLHFNQLIYYKHQNSLESNRLLIPHQSKQQCLSRLAFQLLEWNVLLCGPSSFGFLPSSRRFIASSLWLQKSIHLNTFVIYLNYSITPLSFLQDSHVWFCFLPVTTAVSKFSFPSEEVIVKPLLFNVNTHFLSCWFYAWRIVLGLKTSSRMSCKLAASTIQKFCLSFLVHVCTRLPFQSRHQAKSTLLFTVRFTSMRKGFLLWQAAYSDFISRFSSFFYMLL